VSYEELATNLGNVAATASANKVPFEQIGAAFIELTRAGINASEAETAITNLMRSISGGGPEAVAYAKSLGVELSAAALESKGLVGVMDEITKATGGATEMIDKMIPEARAAKAALTLAKEGGEGFTMALKEMGEYAGSTGTALSQQVKAASFDMNNMKKEAEVLKGELGDLVTIGLKPTVEIIREGVRWFRSLDDETKQSIVSWGLFALKVSMVGGALAGAVLVFGKVSGVIAGLALAIGAGGTGIGLYGAFVALGLLFTPGGALMIGLAALAAAATAAVIVAKKLGGLSAQNQIESGEALKQQKTALELTKEWHKLSDEEKWSKSSDELKKYSKAFTELITFTNSSGAKSYLKEQAVGLNQIAQMMENTDINTKTKKAAATAAAIGPSLAATITSTKPETISATSLLIPDKALLTVFPIYSTLSILS